MNRLVRVLPALVLFGLAVAGLIHSARAAVAQHLYFRAKYGTPDGQVWRTVALCGKASRWYPYDYYACLLAGERAFGVTPPEKRSPSSPRWQIASEWCDRGLRLNWRSSELRLLKARLLADVSPGEAAVFWDEYVDWHFWEPFNHAVLVEFYVRAGELEKAEASLAWTRKSPYYRTSRELIAAARASGE